MTTIVQTFLAVMAILGAAAANAQIDPQKIAQQMDAKRVAKADTGKGDPRHAAFVARFKKLYPKTKISHIASTELPGIYEVVMGPNIAYVEESGRYFVFGHLFDMRTQKDMSEERLAKLGVARDPAPVAPQDGPPPPPQRIDFASLPLQDAIVTVKGNGKRKLALFSDPDCPFCKRIEESLAKVDNVTIYTFLFPLDGLHPDARRKAIGVWCAPDKAKAWQDLMQKGIVADGNCDNPVERNAAFAAAKNINGTPTLIFADGSVIPGALPADQLERALGNAL
jgi:thiol:disulfide interchange protein DsbC